MRVLVTGGRDYADRLRIHEILHGRDITELATGGAVGADELARQWARDHEIDYRIYPAKWTTEGKAAGPRRNMRMHDAFQPDLVVAFPGGRGTANMVTYATYSGTDLLVV